MKPEVMVYTMQDCIYCINQKKWMEEQQIPYQERNITRSTEYEQEFMDIGGTGTPLTVISVNNSRKIVRGFNKDVLEEFLIK